MWGSGCWRFGRGTRIRVRRGRRLESRVSCELDCGECEVRTSSVIAASGERNDFGTDCGALLGNVGLANILSGNESCESAGDGESLEMHIYPRDILF
jgi:hypothetical protein